MTAACPTFLLFDLGGVLVDFAGFDHLNRLLPQPLPIDALKQRWLASRAVRHFELGESDTQQFATAFLDEWELMLTPNEFLSLFASWIKGIYPGAPELLHKLRRRFRLGCLSNSNALHWTKLESFNRHFDLAMSSHLLGAVKPDSEAFLRALDLCGASAENVLYFDDAHPNVDAARRLGMQAYHADGFIQLRDVLHANGLL